MLPVKNTLFPTVSRFFDDDWNSLFDWSTSNFSAMDTTMPAVNIKETKDAFEVEMAVPGMKRDDFEIELKNNLLTIKCELKEEHEDKGERYTRKEFSYRSFQRSFNLNDRIVDDAKIKANYEDGILHVSLPKKPEAVEKPAKKIKIA